MEPRTVQDFKLVTLARKTHRIAGVGLSLFVLALTLTGLALIHQKGWAWLKHVDVPTSLIPAWGTAMTAQKTGHIKVLAIDPETNKERANLVAATKAGMFAQQAGQWSPLQPAADQPEVTALMIMGSRWLVGTQQGLFTSDDAGKTWLAKSDAGNRPMGKITTIQRSPSRPDVLLAGAKSGAYISRDAGEHWTTLAGPPGSGADLTTEISVIVFDPSQRDYAFLGTKRGLYRYHQESATVEAVDLETLERLIAAIPVKMTLDVYLNDLHTGKLFGDKLWPLYDLTAAALIFFVATGIYMWIYPTLRRRQLGLGSKPLPLTSSSPQAQPGREPVHALER